MIFGLKSTLFIMLFLTEKSLQLPANDIRSPNCFKYGHFPLSNQGLYKELYNMAEYSAISYCINSRSLSEGDLRKACPLESCHKSKRSAKVQHIFVDKISGTIIQDYDEKQLVVSIKGTSTQAEWEIDFAYEKTEYIPWAEKKGESHFQFDCKNCSVHSGFYNATLSFFDSGLNELVNLQRANPDYKVMVTGHSLGAGVAPLIATELRLMGFEVGLINFAGPKFANKPLADWMDTLWNTGSLTSKMRCDSIESFPLNSYVRVTHSNDPVPLMPLIQMGYSHAGCEVHITKDTLPQEIDDITVRGEFREEYEANQISEEFKDAIKSKDMMEVRKQFKQHGGDHTKYLVKISQCNKKSKGNEPKTGKEKDKKIEKTA